MACDPDFANVVLLLNCDGTNGATAFPDSSPAANSVTANGDAQVSTAAPRFGTGAGLFDGSGDYLSMPITPALDLSHVGPFTVEGWFRPADVSNSDSLLILGCRDSSNSNGFTLGFRGDTQTLRFQLFGTGGTTATVATSAVNNTWYHFAIVFDGTFITVYFDGVGGTPAPAGPVFDAFVTAQLRVGADVFSSLTGNYWHGQLDELRITSGIARYTSNFTPSAVAFGVACLPIVPDVVGEDESAAAAEIEGATLVVGTITTASSETVPAGLVLSQDPVGGTEVQPSSAVNLVLSSGLPVCEGVPFEGYIAWPYLDFGILGIDKMMEGFDVVANGTFRVSFGYSQRDFSLATPDYELDGDTLVGGMVPMPLTAPSFQLRLTFDGEQAWEWFASNLYINNEGPG